MTYSPDFRQKVLQKLAEGLSVRKVAQLFGINFMTVQKWKTTPVPKSQQIHPPKKISKDALLADVQAYPTDFLYERAKRFNCSSTAIYKALLRYHISRKKLD